jgi:hypothetical protein
MEAQGIGQPQQCQKQVAQQNFYGQLSHDARGVPTIV